jgi:hypothetical protein
MGKCTNGIHNTDTEISYTFRGFRSLQDVMDQTTEILSLQVDHLWEQELYIGDEIVKLQDEIAKAEYTIRLNRQRIKDLYFSQAQGKKAREAVNRLINDYVDQASRNHGDNE